MAISGYQEVASVHFVESTNNTKVYSFAVYDHVIKAGDYAVVHSKNPYGSNFGVVKVIDVKPVSEHTGTAPTDEIVCKADISSYERRCAMRKDRAALKKKMDKIVKSEQESLLYKTIAESNPEMSELFAEYQKTLGV